MILFEYSSINLTDKNKKDLDRTEKTVNKLILSEKYTTYQEACKTLWLAFLEDRRGKKHLILQQKKSPLNRKMVDLLPKRKQLHT